MRKTVIDSVVRKTTKTAVRIAILASSLTAMAACSFADDEAAESTASAIVDKGAVEELRGSLDGRAWSLATIDELETAFAIKLRTQVSTGSMFLRLTVPKPGSEEHDVEVIGPRGRRFPLSPEDTVRIVLAATSHVTTDDATRANPATLDRFTVNMGFARIPDDEGASGVRPAAFSVKGECVAAGFVLATAVAGAYAAISAAVGTAPTWMPALSAALSALGQLGASVLSTVTTLITQVGSFATTLVTGAWTGDVAIGAALAGSALAAATALEELALAAGAAAPAIWRAINAIRQMAAVITTVGGTLGSAWAVLRECYVGANRYIGNPAPGKATVSCSDSADADGCFDTDKATALCRDASGRIVTTWKPWYSFGSNWTCKDVWADPSAPPQHVKDSCAGNRNDCLSATRDSCTRDPSYPATCGGDGGTDGGTDGGPEERAQNDD